ncbi:response regulator transcription factor [Bradyrhizobium sp. DASA03120]|uniref:response regulator transcription factor n=1 Tax=Bradyrhizobium sp. SMVTL-02 TaxID=3395917 RepID=UPI003F6F9431
MGVDIGTASSGVLIVDDAEFRASVGRLLRTVGMHSEQFASITEFLAAAPNPNGPTCLLVDMRMPRPSGLDLQRELANVGKHLPIVFITAHADIPMTVLATKRDAIEFLTQPFRDQDLIDAVEAGLARDRDRRNSAAALAAVKERYETLSSREREIMVRQGTGMSPILLAAYGAFGSHSRLEVGTSKRTFTPPTELPTVDGCKLLEANLG